VAERKGGDKWRIRNVGELGQIRKHRGPCASEGSRVSRLKAGMWVRGTNNVHCTKVQMLIGREVDKRQGGGRAGKLMIWDPLGAAMGK